MVASMKKGAVIVDVAVDQGGCIETTRAPHLSPRGRSAQPRDRRAHVARARLNTLGMKGLEGSGVALGAALR